MKKHISKSPAGEISLAQIAQLKNLVKMFSSEFANCATSKIDENIQWALRRIVECLDVDHASFWKMVQNGTELKYGYPLKYQYTVPRYENDLTHLLPKYFPWLTKRSAIGEVTCLNRIDELPEEARVEQEAFQAMGVKSFIQVPYKFAGRVINGITLSRLHAEIRFPAELTSLLKLIGEIISNSLFHKQMEEKYESALMAMQKTSEQLPLDEICLHRDVERARVYHNIIGRSAAITDVFLRMEQVAPTDSIVLILGETGTGKGLIAKALHELSPRKNHPLVTVNCAAFPPTLLESELFGRERGAFTGSDSRQIGRFEFAHKSTIVLDEITELPLELQAKLLRVIQDCEFERLGSPKTIKVDTRIIAVSSRDLKADVSKGNFRPELFYRLNVFPIKVPPLRERNEDIPLLVNHFVELFSRKMEKKIKTIHKHTMSALKSYAWPGNVRQLEHVIERAVIITKGSTLHLAEDLRDEPHITDDGLSVMNLAEVEKRHIIRVLEKTKWRIEGESGAAVLLGLNPSTLRGRMRKFHISFRPSPSPTS